MPLRRAKSTSRLRTSKNRLSISKRPARQRMDVGLKNAISKYRKAATFASESVGHDEEGPFLVAKGVSKYAFEQWSAVQEKKWQLFWNRLTGEVWLYGDPSPLHETAHSFFTFFLGHLLKSDAVSLVTTSGSLHSTFQQASRSQILLLAL